MNTAISHPSPVPTLRIAGLLCGLVGLSAIGLVGASLLAGARPSWFLASFEFVVALAGVLGVLAGLGRFRENPPLALACVAGTVLIGSFLGCLGAKWDLAGHSLRPVLGARFAAGGLIALCAAWMVLSTDLRRTLPRLVKGLLVGAALVALLVALWSARSRLGTMSIGARFVTGIIAIFVLTGLLSAAVHLVITAFQLGLVPRNPADPPEQS